MPPGDAGAKALGRIDAALSKKPERDGPELSAALRCLAELRDSLVQAHRASGASQPGDRLERVNAVISCVMAVQHPLGEVQWPELEKARGWLAAVLHEA